MIFYLTMLLFLCAFASARTLSRSSASRPDARAAPLFTFIVDPPTFFLVGLLVAMAGMLNLKKRKLSRREFLTRKRIIDIVLLLFVLGFWTMEVLTYFNVMGHPLDPAKTGNDFMWNGYLDALFGTLVDTTTPTYVSPGWNALALALLFLQLPFLWLGRSLGYNSGFFNDFRNWTRPKK